MNLAGDIIFLLGLGGLIWFGIVSVLDSKEIKKVRSERKEAYENFNNATADFIKATSECLDAMRDFIKTTKRYIDEKEKA